MALVCSSAGCPPPISALAEAVSVSVISSRAGGTTGVSEVSEIGEVFCSVQLFFVVVVGVFVVLLFVGRGVVSVGGV
jgi:hypothetical protein